MSWLAKCKKFYFRLRGKDPDAVVVVFRSGEKTLADAMAAEVRSLVPDRRVFEVEPAAGSAWSTYWRLRRQFAGYRIGLAPILLGDQEFSAVRWAAFFLAPGKILAYNGRLERHHLRLSTPIASLLFLRGVPLDRIFLRPRWWPIGGEASTYPQEVRVFEGRKCLPARPRIAVLSPYFPFPLSHGGAVRIFNLLRELAREFDVLLFAFTEGGALETSPVLEFCARVVIVEKPRYREPRWSTLRPPEVCEYSSPAMQSAIELQRRDFAFRLFQTEYTYLAGYGGDILVEHDVTFDLFTQVYARRGTWPAWWDAWRWRRFELAAVQAFRRVIVMSEKDRAQLAPADARVVPNGVDLERFSPQPEPPGRRLLFIGSFRHFPNIEAFRFFVGEIWPRLAGMDLTVVAGPEPLLHWRSFTGALDWPRDPQIRMLEFVSDVRPLYHETNLVLCPTLESAGTNVKVLEAMAMERAVIATPSGCAGLGVEHRKTGWIAATAADFAEGVDELIGDEALRRGIATAGRRFVEERYGWTRVGELQRALIRELL